VNLLLDTHALLWWLFDDRRLTAAAREAIAAPRNRVVVSAVSGWEIATKHRIGRLPDAGAAATDLPALLKRARFEELPVALRHGMAAGALRGPHRDPFDRMLIAQAQLESLRVVSNDPVFRAYGLAVLW